MKEENVRDNIVSAAKWSSVTEIAVKFVTPVTNMILARIIAPEAFGVIATVTMLISFADMFADSGFQKYLIQHEFEDDVDKHKYANVAFWTNFGISLFLWIIIILFCKPIAALVGNPELGNVLVIAAVQLPITSFSSIQIALYRRNLDFRALFFVRIVSVFIPFVVTIPLALLGLSYWALIIGTIAMQISNAVMLTVKSKWKPGLFYNPKILKKMFSFSFWSLIEAISIWLSSWVDILIIGNVLSQYYLGLYSTSISMVNSLIYLILAAVLPVLFSSLSRLQKDNERFNYIFFKFQRITSVLIFPLGIGVFLYSDLATHILLGSQWKEASGVIGIWALTRSIKAVLGDFYSEVYRAKGRPKLSFLAQIIHLSALIPTCIITSQYGFWALVYARAWIQMQFVLVHLIVMKTAMGVPILKTIRNILPTAVSAAAMGIFGFYLKQMSEGMLWSLVSIVLCALFYFGVLLLFPNMRNEIINLARRLMPKGIKKMFARRDTDGAEI